MELNELRERAKLPNALHGCTSDPCGSVVCQTARDRDALLSRLEQAEQKVASLEAKMDGENLRWVAWEMVENSGHLDLPIVAWINRISDDEVSIEAAKYFFFGGTPPCLHLGSDEPFEIEDDDRPACEHCNRRTLDGDGRG